MNGLSHAVIRCVLAGMVVALFTSAATADWRLGDSHKMHYPQMPDPTGWDVDVVTDYVWDDFKCAQTGPITDIHFWISYQQDVQIPISEIWTEIWTDVPAGEDPNPDVPWSHPGNMLWRGTFDPSQFIIAPPDQGDQGWVAPNTTEPIWAFSDHDLYYQVNIPFIDRPFLQEVGSIYWLGIHIIPAGTPQTGIGWKTSVDHFNDDAVYYFGGWKELTDPQSGESIDMAFVITPEPATLAVMAIGMLVMRRRG